MRSKSVLLGSALGLLALTAWGIRALARSVAAEPQYALAQAQLALAGGAPEWISPGILAEIHRTCVIPQGGSLLAPGAAERLAASLSECPWVKVVRAVDLDASPRIVLDLEFREPVARVAWGNAEGWVDADGILLPKGLYRKDALPVLRGVRTRPPAKAGLPWKDPALRAGLALLGRLRPAVALESVDVTNYGERRPDVPEIVCSTLRGPRLRFSSGLKPGRPTLEEQMGRFAQVLKVDRDLRLAREYVDLRFDRPVGS